MIKDFERLAYDPDSIYGASKKLTTDRLRRMEYRKLNPDVVQQGQLGYNVTDINYNAGLFEDALVRILANIKKIFSYIRVLKRPIQEEERGGARRRLIRDTGRRVSTETAPGDDSTGRRVSTETAPGYDSDEGQSESDEGQSESDEEEEEESAAQSTLNSYQNMVNVPGSIAFDPTNNSIQASFVRDELDDYSLPSYGTSVYTFAEKPIENSIIGLLVDTATLIQQANTFFNGKIKKHITMLSSQNIDSIVGLVTTIKQEFDGFYNSDIQRYLHSQFANGEELVNDIRNKLDKLQIDVAIGTRSSAIQFVGATGAGRGFVPLKIHAPFRAIPTKYAL